MFRSATRSAGILAGLLAIIYIVASIGSGGTPTLTKVVPPPPSESYVGSNSDLGLLPEAQLRTVESRAGTSFANASIVAISSNNDDANLESWPSSSPVRGKGAVVHHQSRRLTGRLPAPPRPPYPFSATSMRARCGRQQGLAALKQIPAGRARRGGRRGGGGRARRGGMLLSFFRKRV